MSKNYMFRPGLTIIARIDPHTWNDKVELQNVRVVGVNSRYVIVGGDYQGITYYDTMTVLEITFLFPECNDRDKCSIQDRLWLAGILF